MWLSVAAGPFCPMMTNDSSSSYCCTTWMKTLAGELSSIKKSKKKIKKFFIFLCFVFSSVD
jgi:hypothetical protein